MIESKNAEQLLSAYRATVTALEELRQGLVAAGVLEVAAASESSFEPPADRARRLRAERQRRWRERRRVDGGASTDEKPAASTERLHVDGAASTLPSTDRLPTVYAASTSGPDEASRVRAFLIGEITSPLVSSLTLRNTPPLIADGDGLDRTVGPVAEGGKPDSGGTSGRRPRKGHGRERPALRSGSTTGGSTDSPPVSTPDRALEGEGVVSASTAAGRVWSVYVETVAPTRVRRTPARDALIVRRLRDYTAEELERAIRGYGRSAWHRGENDRGRPYLALELWLRDAAHIEAGWSYLDGKAADRPAKKGAPTLDGIEQEWKEYEARLAIDRDVFADT